MLEGQNQEKNIEILAAQRQLYSDAKYYLKLAFIPSVVIMSAFTIAEIVTESDLQFLVFGSSLLLILLNDFYFLPKVDKLRQLAAELQDKFDTDVLDVVPRYFKSNKIDETFIKSFANKFLSETGLRKEELENWYEIDTEGLPDKVIRLLCQRSNFLWDADLGRAYVQHTMRRLTILVIFSALVLMIANSFFDIGLDNMFMLLIAAVSPTFALFWRQYTEHSAAVDLQTENLKFMDGIWAKARSGNFPTESGFRQIQDELLQVRASRPLIPDAFYKSRLSTQQNDSNKFFKTAIAEYKQGCENKLSSDKNPNQ